MCRRVAKCFLTALLIKKQKGCSGLKQGIPSAVITIYSMCRRIEKEAILSFGHFPSERWSIYSPMAVR